MHHRAHHAPLHHLGIRDAARRLGLAHTTVGRYVRAFPELNRGSAGRPKVDLDELRRHRAANLNPAPRGRLAAKLLAEAPAAATGPANTPNYADSKAKREAVLADRAQVDLDEKRGLLVPRAEVEYAAAEIGALLQQELLELGGQLADRLASSTEPHEIVALLDAAHRRVLAAMSATLAAKDWARHENTQPPD